MFNQSWLLPDAYNERLFPQTNGWTAVVRTDYSETRNFTPTQTANTRPTARRWFAFYDKVGASIPGPVNFTSTTAASRKPSTNFAVVARAWLLLQWLLRLCQDHWTSPQLLQQAAWISTTRLSTNHSFRRRTSCLVTRVWWPQLSTVTFAMTALEMTPQFRWLQTSTWRCSIWQSG